MLGVHRAPLPRQRATADSTKQVERQPAGGPASENAGPEEITAFAATTMVLPPDEESEEWDSAGADIYDVIRDTGTGAAIGSIEAMEQQGGIPDRLREWVRPLEKPLRFNTAIGILSSSEGIDVRTQGASALLCTCSRNAPWPSP